MYHEARFAYVISARCRLSQFPYRPAPLGSNSVNRIVLGRTMSTVKSLKKRAVAGTFLFRLPEDDSSKKVEVALFRRSGKVRTYQHKLAPISGSVEEEDASPLATALREIKEETTLDLTSIELLRKGKPYSFIDDDIGREWTINPFAFRLKSTKEGGKGEAGITIDWEHDGWEWHDPLKIKDSDDFGGVPKLVNSLRRVWPEYDLGPDAGGALTDGLMSLRTDHESGARQLATKAVTTLRDVILKLESTNVGDIVWWKNIRMAAWHLSQNGRESMGAAINSAMVSVLADIEAVLKARDVHDKEIKQHVLARIDEYLTQQDSAVDHICDSFVDYIKSNVLKESAKQNTLSVLTLSSSSTILSSLKGVAASLDVTLDLRILESRPLYEGVTLASKFLNETDSNRSVNVTIYSDASAAIAAKNVDIVLFGADRISSSGDISNKTGTLPALLSTLYASPQAKVIVLSDVGKIAGPGATNDHPIEENDPEELSRGWDHVVEGANILREYSVKTHDIAMQSAVVVKNVYFEWVPARMIDAYITDQGVWSVDDIKKRSDCIERETSRVFGDF